MSVCVVTLWLICIKVRFLTLLSNFFNFRNPKFAFFDDGKIEKMSKSTNENGPAAILTTNFQTVFYTRDVFPVVFCHYTPLNKVVGGYTGFTMSVRLQTNPMSYDNLSYVSQNLLKFYQLFTGEERRIPFIFDDLHFCCSRDIGLDMMQNRIFTLCRMIT